MERIRYAEFCWIELDCVGEPKTVCYPERFFLVFTQSFAGLGWTVSEYPKLFVLLRGCISICFRFPGSSWSCQCPCGCDTVVKRYIIICISGTISQTCNAVSRNVRRYLIGRAHSTLDMLEHWRKYGHVC